MTAARANEPRSSGSRASAKPERERTQFEGDTDMPPELPSSPASGAHPNEDAALLDENEKVRPHPSSPGRDAMLAERRFVERAKEAAQQGDPNLIRQVLRQHEEGGFDEDFSDFREAFTAIAACLEGRSAAALAQAEKFIEERRGSTHRRRVRRYCQLD
jgi:hypothetical protein